LIKYIPVFEKLLLHQTTYSLHFDGVIDHAGGQLETVSENEQDGSVLDELCGIHDYILILAKMMCKFKYTAYNMVGFPVHHF
jgi:hypothetical protein